MSAWGASGFETGHIAWGGIEPLLPCSALVVRIRDRVVRGWNPNTGWFAMGNLDVGASSTYTHSFYDRARNQWVFAQIAVASNRIYIWDEAACTWSNVVLSAGGGPNGIGGLWTDESTGSWIASGGWNGTGLELRVSTDGGATWSAVGARPVPIGANRGNYAGEGWSNHSGRTFLGGAAFNDIVTAGGGGIGTVPWESSAVSDDEGQSWTFFDSLYGTVGCAVVYGNAGTGGRGCWTGGYKISATWNLVNSTRPNPGPACPTLGVNNAPYIHRHASGDGNPQAVPLVGAGVWPVGNAVPKSDEAGTVSVAAINATYGVFYSTDHGATWNFSPNGGGGGPEPGTDINQTNYGRDLALHTGSGWLALQRGPVAGFRGINTSPTPHHFTSFDGGSGDMAGIFGGQLNILAR